MKVGAPQGLTSAWHWAYIKFKNLSRSPAGPIQGRKLRSCGPYPAIRHVLIGLVFEKICSCQYLKIERSSMLIWICTLKIQIWLVEAHSPAGVGGQLAQKQLPLWGQGPCSQVTRWTSGHQPTWQVSKCVTLVQATVGSAASCSVFCCPLLTLSLCADASRPSLSPPEQLSHLPRS